MRDMLVYDPDGSGPLGERVIVSGRFEIAGDVFAENLAIYDPVTRAWQPFGPGPYPQDLLLGMDDGGTLFVAGDFDSIAGVPSSNIARFDGVSWSALAGGVAGTVSSMHVSGSGSLVVGGNIVGAGGVPTNGVAVWDGSSWPTIGAIGTGYLGVRDVVLAPNGDVFVAVDLSSTSSFRGVMRYDGATWSPLGSSMGSTPRVLKLLPTGELLAGGAFLTAGPNEQVLRWTGASWHALSNSPFADVYDVSLSSFGLPVVLGSASGASGRRVATWDGLTWSVLGGLNGSAYSLALLANGELLVGGSQTSADGQPTGPIARWTGLSWSPASPGLVGSRVRLSRGPGGSVFVASSADRTWVWRWNGLGWSELPGLAGTSPSLTELLALSNGDVVLGNWGLGGSPALQRHDGWSWTTLATSSNAQVWSVVELPDGDLVAAGSFHELDGVPMNHVARYDGVSWQPLGGFADDVEALACSSSGELFAAAMSRVYRWNGTGWVQVGFVQAGSVTELVIGSDDRPILGGDLVGADVLRWTGTTWQPLGAGPAGPVASLVVMPNGHVIAGPSLDYSDPPRPLERWDGTTWSPLGGDIDDEVEDLAVGFDGSLLLAGPFSVADGVVRCRFARVGTSCAATVLSESAGCSQSYLAPVLAPVVLPWIGGKCRSRAGGVSPGAFAIVVTGLQQLALPLDSLHPSGAGSCQLLVAADVVQLSMPGSGEVAVQFPVAPSAALIGAEFRQQVLEAEVDPAGALTALRASNALAFQVGAF